MGKRISQLTALESASLNTTIVGVDGGTTYKIELDTLADAVKDRINTIDDIRLDSLESFTASYVAIVIPNGTISSSVQLTSSFDERYTLSGSIQDTILPADLISSSAQITTLGFISSSTNIDSGSLATTGSNTFNGNQTISGSIILENGAVIKDNESDSVSFGLNAGLTNQGTQSVAIGNGAGYSEQSHGSVAVGVNAGAINQGLRAVAIGSLAGTNTQGEYAIAIGNFAAPNNQGANSIVISATGTGLENTNPNSLVIAPIRNVTGSSGVLQYNDVTKEVSYSDSIVGSITASNGIISSSAQITAFGFISSSQTINTSSLATTGSNTFVGNQIVSGTLTIATNSGDEGGEILLGKAVTNTTLTGSGVVVDIFRDRVRIFEESGTTRGAFLNVASQSSGVSSQIVTSPNLFSIQTITSASYAALTPVSGTLYVIIG